MSSPTKQASPDSAPASWRLLLGLGLVLATLLVYSRSFDQPFIDFDDPDYVTENPYVKAGLTADSIAWAFTSFDCANWHPLTWLSLQLDATCYGTQSARGFHITNVLLHAANTLLVFLLLNRLTGQSERSAVVAALFALHPLHVESVAWVTERKDVLSTFFWLLTMAAYLHYLRAPSVRRYVLLTAVFALGLMAKPMLVTLPCVLLLLDYWPLGRWRPGGAVSWWRPVVEKLPLFILVLASCLVTLQAQSSGGLVQTLKEFPLSARVGNALLSYVAYIVQMLWPTDLAIFYPHPGAALPWGQAIGAGLLLLLISGLVLGPGRRWPYLAVGWLWYVVTLLPVIGLVQVALQGRADRYTYIPLLGLFVLLTWGGSDLARRWEVSRLVLGGATAGVLLVCAGLTWVQIGYWSSDFQLWQHALAVSTPNAVTYNNVGAGLHRRGQRDKALAAYDQALQLDPTFTQAHHNLGLLLLDLGRPEQALHEFQQALALAPEFLAPRERLAQCCYQLGLLNAAREQFQRVVEREPASASAHFNLGLVLADLSQQEQAADQFRHATELDPGNWPAQAALAQILLEQGHYTQAEAQARRVLAMLPGHHAGRGMFEQLLERCRQLQELEAKMNAVANGSAPSLTPQEHLEWARICQQPRRGRYVAAVQHYRAAFADAELGEKFAQPFRYALACAAAQAGTGKDTQAGPLKAAELASYRNAALEGLKADLEYRRKQAAGRDPKAKVQLQKVLRRMQQDAALAGVREPAALAALPETERRAWEQFWREVAALMADEPREDR